MTKHLLVLALALVAACSDPVESPPDASDVSACCAESDDSAALACFLAEPGTPPSGTCGAFVCPSDGGIRRINFCIP